MHIYMCLCTSDELGICFPVRAPKIVSMSTKNAVMPGTGVARELSVEEPNARYVQGASQAADKSLAKAARSAARNQFMKMFGQRCRQARERMGMEIGDAATRMGLHRNTVGNIERGDSLPDVFDLELMARLYLTTSIELLSGDDPAPRWLGGVTRSTRTVQLAGYIFVPEFDVHVSAGSGFFNDIESVVTMRPFDEAYIQQELGIRHDELALIKVVGQSMEPDLRSRDTVLVDLQDRDVFTDGIHILRLDGALLIKKIQRLPGKILRVSSSNTSYESFDIRGSDESERDFEVLGRVRWAGVTFS